MIFVQNLNILPQNSKFLTYSDLKYTASVLSNAMKYHGAKICANSPTNIDTDNIFQFFMIFAQNLIILPQNSTVWTYTTWNTKNVRAYIILKVMNYSSTKFYAISSPNMDTDNIFQFIVNFAQNLTILPQNSKVLTYTDLKHI